MKQTATQFGGGLPRACTRLWLVGWCVSAVVLSGCAERKVKAKTFPWSTVAMVRPRPLAMLAAPGDQAVDLEDWPEVRELQLDVPPPPSPLAAVQSVPPRPRVPAAPSGQNASARPEPLQILPQLTPEETTAAQQQTNVSLSIAERNIGTTQGKSLNATQLDLASKVRSFIAEAREAAHIGDWTRARNAAKKAQVLSEELARSL
jgi:hypothetical protein